jgi:hypothetical protein
MPQLAATAFKDESWRMMHVRWKRGAALIACGLGLVAPPGHAAVTPAQAKTLAGLQRELDQLEAELIQTEDVSAIRKLQREYGFFIDKGLWEDLSALFTDDARASYPAGVFVGKASIREHIWRNVGDGTIGIKDGRVYNHMVLQPVINVAPDGRTAKGRWRVLAMIGRLADPSSDRPGQATWAGGIYENVYVKQDGVWKIKDLRYYNDFAAPYEGGWAKVAPIVPVEGASSASAATAAPTRSRFTLAHQPDQPRDEACPGYPAACIQPFHYDNPVSGRKNQP